MVAIDNLHFCYGKKEVFKDLSLQMRPGNIYGLLGRNGTGKSTLLSNIAGLLFPGRGSIDVLGFVPAHRQPDFLRDIFMIPEEFYLPDISIPCFIRYSSPFYCWFNEEVFREYLQVFNIPYETDLQNLSYGQKKKVLISFGIAANTSILLMDEPTNGLDIAGKSQFRKIIAGAFDHKKSVMISSHQVKDLENLIDSVIIIEEAGIALDESIQRIGSKLDFTISYDPEEISSAIYSEPLLRGHAVVLMNNKDEESKIDLELLYKAVMVNPTIIQHLFKDKT